MTLLWLALILQPSWAQEAPSPAPLSTETENSWDQGLNGAIKAYLEGDLDSALAQLGVLLSQDHPVSAQEILKAWSYQAEVQYFLGNRQDAWATMLLIVEKAPDFRLDPFIHPPEIVSYFDSVRAAAKQSQPQQVFEEPASQAAFPAVLIPGVWQLRNDQPVLGITSATAVAGLSLATVLLYNRVEAMDQEPGRPGIQVHQESDQALAEELKAWTNIARVAAGGVWAGAALQGWVRSVTNADAQASFWMAPSGAGVHIVLHK